MIGVGLVAAIGLHLEDLILDLGDLVPDHFVLGHQVAVYVLLVYVLLGGRVFYEELLKVLQLYLQCVVVVADDHVVLLRDFSCVS